MTYWEVGKLPLRTFWSFNRQIDRLRAERDQRQFRLMGAAQSAESANELLEALRVELDCPVVVTKSFDEAKFAELASRLGGGA